jgi:two-component system cell cycle response regulator DivK
METPAPRTPLTILLVEDNPVDAAIIRRVLDTHDFLYYLRIMEDGERALRFFEQLAQEEHGIPPDILLLDLTLPQVSGQELLQRVKAIPACRHMRIVVVTAYNYLTTQQEARQLGADAFFTKPTTFPAFMQLGDLIKTAVVDTTQGK